MTKAHTHPETPAPARHDGSDPVPAEELAGLVATATRAPSVHNIQPWRFVHTADGTLELYVDPSRALEVADPRAREVVISCGAALFNLRLAVRGLGLSPIVDTTARLETPTFLASLRVQPGTPATPDEQRLLAAVARRHTHRGGFTGPPLTGNDRDELAAAAAVEGAWLRFPEADDAAGIARLAQLADAAQHADPEWREEMVRWTPAPGRESRDGVPPAAYPPDGAHTREHGLPPRDFSLGRNWGWVASDESRGGTIAVLLTDDDHMADWLRAGQALQRILLDAAGDWIFATFATQPMEVPHFRAVVRDVLQTRGFPQMVLEIGHAHSAAVTPRRPVDEVLRAE